MFTYFTPFTRFLRLVSVYRPFQIYFIPKTFHKTSVFSSLLKAYFYLTGHSPLFIYNTALLYIILLTLCGHLHIQRVCRTLHPVSGEDGILVAEVPLGVPHAFSARTSPRRVVGLAPGLFRASCLNVLSGLEWVPLFPSYTSRRWGSRKVASCLRPFSALKLTTLLKLS